MESEIKYSFKRRCWGRGFATEAVLGLLEYGSKDLGIESFIATVDPLHQASQNVLKKAGFTQGPSRFDDEGEVLVFEWGHSLQA